MSLIVATKSNIIMSFSYARKMPLTALLLERWLRLLAWLCSTKTSLKSYDVLSIKHNSDYLKIKFLFV